ncbi:MAG: Macrolide-specific efflux protein macA precursor [Phycisphaerales bacterium]|nr:Macrolide-specific efflux protein macA precursor [Phycisphaerales bacterium]
MRKPAFLSVLVTCAALSGAIYAEAPATAPATGPATRPATQPTQPTSAVHRGALSMVVDVQGSFEPLDPYEVRLRLKAYQGELTINSIAANGAAVKKGDTLLEIDPAVIKRQLAAVENEAMAARASLDKAEADAKVTEQAEALAARQQEDALKEAQDGVKWFETVDGPQMLKQVDLILQQSQNQVNDEQDELDQLKKMYKGEELTVATADIVVKRAVRNLELGKELLAMSKERANKIRTFMYPITKQRVYDALETAKEQHSLFQTAQAQNKVLRQTGLAAVRAAAAAADLKLSDLKADSEKLTVHAAADGVVSYGQIVGGNWQGGDPRSLKVGEKVAAQTVLLTLYTPGRLRLVADLPEAKFFAVQPGQKASVSPVAMPELKYEGMCDAVPRTAAGSPAGAVYAQTISTGDVDTRLVPGMKAQVHMDVPLVDNVLLVPTTAVANSTVSLKVGDNIESRHVMTGRSDGKMIEILSGLHDGDEVLTQAKQ